MLALGIGEGLRCVLRDEQVKRDCGVLGRGNSSMLDE